MKTKEKIWNIVYISMIVSLWGIYLATQENIGFSMVLTAFCIVATAYHFANWTSGLV